MSLPRAGATSKVSVSLSGPDLAALQRHARRSHRGNLSAAVADAVQWLRQEEARRQVVALLGGPVLTPDAARALDAEWGLTPPAEGRPRTSGRRRAKRVP